MDHHAMHKMVDSETSPIEYLKLAAIIAAIVGISYLLNSSLGDGTWQDYLRWFMGVFFVVFASFKLIGYKMFAMMFAGYDVLARRFKTYAYAYPFIELGLGLLYVADALPFYRDILTVLIMAVSVVGVIQELQKRSGIHCACLGNVIKLPLSTVSFLEDAGMGLMALVMLVMR